MSSRTREWHSIALRFRVDRSYGISSIGTIEIPVRFAVFASGTRNPSRVTRKRRGVKVPLNRSFRGNAIEPYRRDQILPIHRSFVQLSREPRAFV